MHDLQEKNTNTYLLKKETIEHAIHGFDIDPEAINISALRLWFSLLVEPEANENQEDIDQVAFLLQKRDSLDQSFLEQPLYDVVIGNPPYGVSLPEKQRECLKTYLGEVPDHEIYYYFIEIAAAILKNNGVLSYIIPNTWLGNIHARNYRTNLPRRWILSEIIDCKNFKLFGEAEVFNTIITWQKGIADEVGYKESDPMQLATLLHQPQKTLPVKSLLEYFNDAMHNGCWMMDDG